MPDYFQILAQQISAKIETTPGTEISLTSADCKLRPFQSNCKFTADYKRFTNDEVADDIGQAADFVSGKAGKIDFGCVLKTSGVLGTVPAVGVFLRACGLKEQNVKQITVGSITGGDTIFAAGETYSASSGTKTGTIESTLSSSGVLRYVILTGSALANADVVTAGGDSATASGASTDHSVKYSPRSTGMETVTLQRGIKNSNGTSAQDYLQRLKGVMGTGKIDFAALDALRFIGEFSGCHAAAGAGSMFTGVTFETATNANLPKLINSTIQLNGVSVRPSAISFDIGNTVELDPDPSTGGGTIGYDQARISRREPKLTIDPYRLKPGTLDDLGLLGDGSEIPVSIICGTSPNLIEIAALKCQVREDSLGDRAGLETSSLTLFVVRNSLTDNDFSIYFR